MAERSILRGRSSGVLLHPTSLPGTGVGDLGAASRRFIDWLARAGQRYWQILPLVPVDSGGSPYNGLSALAGNPLLISPELLFNEGLVGWSDTEPAEPFPRERIDFPRIVEWKESLLASAHQAFRGGAAPHLAEPFAQFREANASWLEDYALFRALRHEHAGAPWVDWPVGLRRRSSGELSRAAELLQVEVERFAFQQFLFSRELGSLRAHAKARGVQIIGDIPIFVAHDSADVWAHSEIFQLDEEGQPTAVAGVPPDYFSKTGQRWGNPLYRWDVLRRTGYDWWVRRFRRTLAMCDVVRIDHFRGFQAYWEVPAEEETAVNGRWVAGPGAEFFRVIEERLGGLPVIAEDLGLITSEVDALRDTLGLPGMRVLQFAFDGNAANPHLPSNYPPHCVAYTGTHDNDTVMGWWSEASEQEKRSAQSSLDLNEPGAWDFIEVVLSSEASLAVIPLQDLLQLGSEARMNTPGRAADNWTWRTPPGEPGTEVAERLHDLARGAARTGA